MEFLDVENVNLFSSFNSVENAENLQRRKYKMTVLSPYRQAKSRNFSSKRIPVYVNTFNRLTTTKTLVEQILCFENARPIIVDNGSTWAPLLAWYQTSPCEIVRLDRNLGCRAVWRSEILRHLNSEWYVVTDCDLDLSGIPLDVLEFLKIPFGWKTNRVDKVGLSLVIDDLPEWQTIVRKWESQFWRNPVPFDSRFYFAAVDTTFALYRNNSKLKRSICVRADKPYSARHVPWYQDCTALDEENLNYYLTATSDNSWKPKDKHLSGDAYERALDVKSS